MLTAIPLILAAAGAALYRARGMGIWPGRPWLHIACSLIYAAAAYALNPWLTIPIAVLTTAALLTGHASYIDLGSIKPGGAGAPADGQQDEWYGAWLPGSGYWHDFAGLAISGLLVTLPCGLAYLFAGYTVLGLAIALSGTLKAVAYAAARVITSWAPAADIFTPISLGEILAGAAFWGSIASIVAIAAA